MLERLKGAIGLLVIFAVFYFGYGLLTHRADESTATAARPSGGPQQPSEALDVSLFDLPTEFAVNALAAEAKYKGKRLKYDGLFYNVFIEGDRIALGTNVPPSICWLRSGQKDTAAKLIGGQSKVWMRGVLVSVNKSPELNDCEIINYTIPE